MPARHQPSSPRARTPFGTAMLFIALGCLGLLFFGCKEQSKSSRQRKPSQSLDAVRGPKGQFARRARPKARRAYRAKRRSRRSRRLRGQRKDLRPARLSPGSAPLSAPAIPSPAPVARAAAAPSGGGGAQGSLNAVAPAKRKGSKKKMNKPKAQVWQRSKDNTVLSKVSVGGKKYLILRNLRVTVSVEGLRARTVIDHIYYNPHHRQLQGTFKYTLPTQASVSYYAMFIGRRQRRAPRFFGRPMRPEARQKLAGMRPDQMVRRMPKPDWGKLREARLVGAEKGREVYEEITRQRIDPALLEQDAPNTFTGRVFPIPARGYNRVIIAYEQTLPQLQDEFVYRFRFPPEVAKSIDFSLEYNDKLASVTRSNLRRIRCKAKLSVAFVRCYWEQNKPDRDAVFYFKPKHKHVNWVAGTDPMENRHYLYARARVQLPKGPTHFNASHGLFALDTSLSANPDLFAAHVALLNQILARNEKRMPHFNLLLFDTGSRWFKRDGWMANTAKNRRQLLGRLRRVILEGATDFSGALQALAVPSWRVKAGTPVDIFVLSDGQINWGETKIEGSLARFRKRKIFGVTRFFTYQMGIGAENAVFQQRLAREGGAQFSCLGRAELARCAVAHTRPSMLLEEVKIKGIGAREILVEGRQVSLYPGAMVGIAARFTRDGMATIVMRGQYQGKPITVTQKINVKAEGELAPRAWAELAVAQLSELDSNDLTPLIVAYSQHFRIPNQHCSMLVLETDKEYKKYGLDNLRKSQRVRDLGRFIADWIRRFGKAQSQRKRWLAIIEKGARRAKMWKTSAGRAMRRMFFRVPKSSFSFVSARTVKRWDRYTVPAYYVGGRLRDRNEFGPFVKEAKRRLREDVGGAIRALSSIVELHPSNPQALRLVAYYLMSWQRPAEAAQIFLRVLERRSFEPHSYRDLARALVKMERYALAAVLYEIAIAGRWHRRFRSIGTVLREEYAMLVFRGTRAKVTPLRIRRSLRNRGSLLGLSVRRSRLRVTVTWNTDNTDVDLWVNEPNGQRCSYRRRRTHNGGSLLQDITRGYGPERYENVGGMKGEYNIRLQFYGHRTNVLGNETHVSVTIVTDAGTKRQKIIEKNLVLKRRKQVVDVARLSL